VRRAEQVDVLARELLLEVPGPLDLRGVELSRTGRHRDVIPRVIAERRTETDLLRQIRAQPALLEELADQEEGRLLVVGAELGDGVGGQHPGSVVERQRDEGLLRSAAEDRLVQRDEPADLSRGEPGRSLVSSSYRRRR